jgi:uncharacterized protein YkwD
MRHIVAFIVLNFIFQVNCSATWNDSLYRAYTCDTFFKLSEVNKEINLDSIDYSLLNAALFYQANKYRVKYGRTEFKYSRALEKAAFEHSSDMGQLKFNDHENIIENKKYLWQRLLLVGINEDACYAENIASSTNGLLIVCIYPWDSSSKKKY